MTSFRRISTFATVAAVALGLLAGPASAKSPRGEFTSFAVIDCGEGPIDTGSGDDYWSPLVDLSSGTVYKPIAWHVSGEGFAVDVAKTGRLNKHAVVCSYSDDYGASGTVTVKKA